MKTGIAHRVPLTPYVLKLLTEQRDTCKDHVGLVFRSRRGTEFCDHALTKVLRQNKVPSDAENRYATTHGFRSSFRDWASENQYSSDLAERTLAHVTRDVVEAAYHRTDLLDQRRIMMLAWESFCLGQTAPHRAPIEQAIRSDIEQMISDAVMFRQAQDIRAYVSEVCSKTSVERVRAANCDFDRWVQWACNRLISSTQ
jgi:hypothetical protein